MTPYEQEAVEQLRAECREFLEQLGGLPAVTVAAVSIEESERSEKVEVTFHVVVQVAE